MNSATPVLGLMVGLAVGIDYALFVVNRQRRLILDQGLTAREAAGRAVGTAGSAVFFAGLTVLIALTALTVIGIAMLSTMALVAASTVALAVLIALSLLPALLGLVGERICSDKARARRRAKVEAESHGVADHWVKGVIRFRWPVIAGVVAILGVMAIPAASMNLGIPSGATANQDTAARQSYEAVSQRLRRGIQRPPPGHRGAHRHRRPRHARADRETDRRVPGPRRHRAGRPRRRQRGRRPGRVQHHPHLRPR